MEDKKYCPLCYCLSDTARSPEEFMCEKEKCMWWQDGDCICNIAVRLLGIIAHTKSYFKSGA